MIKYRVVIERDRCIDCGVSIGRCPTHARLLAQVLKQNCKSTSCDRPSLGVFSADLYQYVEKLVKSCPKKALIIEQIENHP